MSLVAPSVIQGIAGLVRASQNGWSRSGRLHLGYGTPEGSFFGHHPNQAVWPPNKGFPTETDARGGTQQVS